MKHLYYPELLFKLSTVFSLMLALFILHSCKKDSTYQDIALNEDAIQAKTWFDNTYPVNSADNTDLSTFGTGRGGDWSQHMRPDWQHNNSYKRLGKNVIELPLEHAENFANGFKDGTHNKAYTKKYSKTSFLILKDDQGYSAFVMVIIADSAYVKGDMRKLSHNTYSKHDADFAGMIIYFTPKGKYIHAYRYKNGHIVTTPAGNNTQSSNAGRLSINEMYDCTDWYMVSYDALGNIVDYQFMYRECTPIPDDGSNPGGGMPPQGCPPVTGQSTGKLHINAGSPDPGDGSGDTGLDPGDGGFPPPTTVNCPVPAIIDSLRKHFPCASKLIIDSLAKIASYANLISPFSNGPASNGPNLLWQNGTLSWNQPNGSMGQSDYTLGTTYHNGNSYNSTITLNTIMLQNSSMLLIAATAIHESLHAIINYNMQMAGYNVSMGVVDSTSWMYGINTWYSIFNMPSNFSNHFEMMDYYFDSAVTTLAQWDNNAHTPKEYEMAMLYGLNNTGVPGSTMYGTVLAGELNTEYTNLMSKYLISAADLNTFYTGELNAPSNRRLPTGCN